MSPCCSMTLSRESCPRASGRSSARRAWEKQARASTSESREFRLEGFERRASAVQRGSRPVLCCSRPKWVRESTEGVFRRPRVRASRGGPSQSERCSILSPSEFGACSSYPRWVSRRLRCLGIESRSHRSRESPRGPRRRGERLPRRRRSTAVVSGVDPPHRR